ERRLATPLKSDTERRSVGFSQWRPPTRDLGELPSLQRLTGQTWPGGRKAIPAVSRERTPCGVEHLQRHALDLRFFYHKTLGRTALLDGTPCPKEPTRLPVILSREEVAQFLAASVHLKSRVMLTLAYAAGLRVSFYWRFSVCSSPTR